MKRNLFVVTLVLMSLCGCRPENKTLATTPSPILTPTTAHRWMMYEAALLKATIGKEDGLCEWSILGISGKEVYVWVHCNLNGPRRTEMSVPAVIYLGENGDIENVTIPRDGEYYPKDIRSLFPSNIQDKIFSHDTGDSIDMEHLEERMNNGGAPLIVVLGTPMP